MSSSVRESQLSSNAYFESRDMQETGEYLKEKAICLDLPGVKALLSQLNNLIDPYAHSLADDRCRYNACKQIQRAETAVHEIYLKESSLDPQYDTQRKDRQSLRDNPYLLREVQKIAKVLYNAKRVSAVEPATIDEAAHYGNRLKLAAMCLDEEKVEHWLCKYKNFSWAICQGHFIDQAIKLVPKRFASDPSWQPKAEAILKRLSEVRDSCLKQPPPPCERWWHFGCE